MWRRTFAYIWCIPCICYIIRILLQFDCLSWLCLWSVFICCFLFTLNLSWFAVSWNSIYAADDVTVAIIPISIIFRLIFIFIRIHFIENVRILQLWSFINGFHVVGIYLVRTFVLLHSFCWQFFLQNAVIPYHHFRLQLRIVIKDILFYLLYILFHYNSFWNQLLLIKVLVTWFSLNVD